MKAFLDKDFLLQTETAQSLFHSHAKHMPIIDYHCHLPVDQIAADHQFKNLTEIWLYGDHYKWRAMRTNGIDEKYCTGDADDYEKFLRYAETVPYTLRNPLYHWTHLELQRYFGIDTLLNGESARKIYEQCNEQLQHNKMSARNILRNMNVKVVCTTDDPADSLEHHAKLRKDGFEIKVLPTFRADKSMAVDDPEAYNTYLVKLEKASDIHISSYQDLLDALRKRHAFFAEAGCKLSDHGIDNFYAEEYQEQDIRSYFDQVRGGKALDGSAILKLKSAILYELALMDHEKGWTQQFHVGAMRNNNSRMLRQIGSDTGFDSIGDYRIGTPMSRFFDRLDTTDQLAKTIIYNLNPRDNYLVGTMIGNFNDGSTPGKMQMGSGWWFLDQKEAMEMQMNALSNLGLLSRFVGMLTDSRSFLSYPRHEYFRRILCNLLGNDVENGELPKDMELLGHTVENICYHNARHFFAFE
ncbi:glucuronate isomerase [Catalinimonas niigatensis]|uniref:glucuronate isomerase n=1 Tax=Catalinimonas niigatensis TaxID=1397264 RepID=UPI0026660945|nr:glucuronate isomerase [Catalinimonas niigatensis]WPP51225.1 glucuronate isomerase [Catalinimonas niigatensis]